MLNRIHPIKNSKKNINLSKFKQQLVNDIDMNLKDYEAFKMKNNNKSEYILLKKDSIHYNLLKKILKVNKPIYVDEI